MSEDLELRDNDGGVWSYDNIKTGAYLEGHIAALDRCARFLEEKSLEMFKRREHNSAIAMQAIAVDMHKQLFTEMRKAVDDHACRYPEMVQEPPKPVLPQEFPVTGKALVEDDDIPF